MEKCIVISDSFKGTLSSADICRIARGSVPKLFPDCQLLTFPVADGGEGTVDCFVEAMGAQRVSVSVHGPYMEPVSADYARIGSKAVIEMAAAAGLPMVGERKNPALTTTYGVGELIAHAVSGGCTEILLGLGGSATNDGGCGCAAALGVKFHDEGGESFVPVGGTLDKICRIDVSAAGERLNGVSITLMSDVENPLLGKMGAAYVFSPQKGADEAMVLELDGKLRHFDEVLRRELGADVAGIPGAGAAGGMGAGGMALLGAGIKSGIQAILELIDFDACLQGAGLVITGEGRLDRQSLDGKVISGIAAHTKAAGVPLAAIVGSVDDSADGAYGLGVTAVFPIDRTAAGFPKMAERCEEDYRRTLEDVLRLYRAAESK